MWVPSVIELTAALLLAIVVSLKTYDGINRIATNGRPTVDSHRQVVTHLVLSRCFGVAVLIASYIVGGMMIGII